MIIPAAIFVVFFLGIYGAHWFFVVRPEDQALGLVRRRMTPTQNVKASLQRRCALGKARTRSALDFEQQRRGKIADRVVHVRVDGRSIRERKIEREVISRPPRREDLAVDSEQGRGGREPVGPCQGHEAPGALRVEAGHVACMHHVL